MLLNSLFFIFAFLPVVLLLYYLLPESFRDFLLFAAGLVFYAWGEPIYVILLLFSVVFHYIMGRHLESTKESGIDRKADMFFAIFVNVFLLCFFKYYGAAVGLIEKLFSVQLGTRELALPIGLSFYTFKNLSYLIDVYRNDVKAERNFLSFAAYATLFPVMTAGPIVRYRDIAEQMKHRRVNIKYLGYGAQRFLIGLGKKILLADSFSAMYFGISNAGKWSVLGAWLGIFAYTMEIYFDFSGYSDMAIGIGQMLGFQFKENFDYPYISKSITEFWRRWHMSLGTWFRDYIYIPLGGNRVGRFKHIRNILIVWCLTGMWHGATLNFIVWGLYYGILLLFEKYYLKNFLEKIPVWAARTYTMLLVMIGWILFSGENMTDIWRWLKALAGIGTCGLADTAFWYYFKTNFILGAAAILASGPWMNKITGKWLKRSDIAYGITYLVLFGCCIACMVFSSYHPFLYLRF